MALNSHSPRPPGFTLIELLAATALFTVLGAMLFQVVSGALDLWTRGERLRELEERAEAVLELVTEDLRHLWCGPVGAGEAQGRLLIDWREEREAGASAGGSGGRRSSVLRFSRLLHESRQSPWLRRAGETAAAEGVADLLGEADPASLRPTGGLAESLYATARLPGQSLPALLRRVRTPIGGAGSLLEPGLPAREDDLLAAALVLAPDVLHFGVLAWGPETTVWESGPAAPGAPALAAWDSTRALVPPGDASFPYGLSPASLFDGRDDLFPVALRVDLVLESGSGGGGAPARLGEPMGPESTRLTLAAALGGESREPDLVWIDGEWLAVTAHDGRILTVERGLRGTLAAAHDEGARVRIGQLFQRVIRLPAARAGGPR